MAEVLALLFCASIGFAIAGTVVSFYQLVTAEPADFLNARSGVLSGIIAVLLIMIGGPVIVIRKIIEGLRASRVAPPVAALGVLVASAWSVLAGMFFLSLLITA